MGQVHVQFIWLDSLDVRFFVVQFEKSCNNGHQSVSLRTTSSVSWPVCSLRALTHVHVHFHVQFMLNFRRRYRNTLLITPVAPCVCHFLFNTSSPPTFRLHLAQHCAFFSESSLMRFCSRNHSEIIYFTHRVVSLRVFCLRQHLDLFKAMTKVAHGSFSWPRDICKQRACPVMLLCMSPRKQHSCIMQTKKVTQKTIAKHLHHTNVSRFAVVQDQFGALQIANISAHQRPACKPDAAASVGGANEDGVV